ncbi:MAG TPA: cytochrome c biogenesis protein ResB [Chloroflexota bacterium]|nr:cytochrome c biogenesis protein ResB [Chloroflexota bacterium]
MAFAAKAWRRDRDIGSEFMAVRQQRLTTPRVQQFSLARLWRGLRSMTFAIFMLAGILAIVVAGSLLPQDTGIRYIYESWWFYGLNFLLMLSVLSCVRGRVRPVYRYAFKVPVVHRPEFYHAADTVQTMEAALPTDLAARAAVKALRRRRYRVETVERDGRTYILADRFRAMRLGSLVSHLGIVLMVASIAWGALAGWLDSAVLVEAGGAPIAIGHGTGLTLRSDSFNFGLYPSGLPRNFQDHLTVIEADGTEHQDTIDVNTPWYYGGIFGYDIHQASYAVSARLIAIDTRQSPPKPLAYCVLEDNTQACGGGSDPLLLAPLGDGSYRPIGSGISAFYLPDRDLAVTLTFHDAIPNQQQPPTAVVTVARPPQKAGQTMRILKEAADIPVGSRTFNGAVEQVTTTPVEVGGVRFILLIRRVAGLNIGHNPAVPFIFTTFALILLGLVSVLYFPFSRLWLYIAPDDGSGMTSSMVIRGSSEKSRQGFKRRFEEIGRLVRRELDAAGKELEMEGRTS